MNPAVVGLVLGALGGSWLGFLAGRFRAEWGRANADMRRNWRSRRDYRD